MAHPWSSPQLSDRAWSPCQGTHSSLPSEFMELQIESLCNAIFYLPRHGWKERSAAPPAAKIPSAPKLQPLLLDQRGLGFKPPPTPRSLSLFCLGALECFNSGMNINTAFGEICWGSAKPCLLQGAFKPAITVYHIRHKEFIVTLHKGGTHSPLCSNTTSIPSPASFPANTAFPRTLWMHSAV